MYGDYLNKLHFGSVSDGIQAMKDHEIASQTNSLDMKSLGLDSDIDKLTGQLLDVQDSTDPATTIESAVSGAGGAIESMATMKKLYSKFKDMKTKAGDKFNELKGKAKDKFDEMKGRAQDKVDEMKGKAEDGSNDLEDRLNALKEGGPDDLEARLNALKEGGSDDLPQPEDGAGSGGAADEEPSEFMDALNNDDFGTMRRLLQQEQDSMSDPAGAGSGGAEGAADDDIVDGPSELNEVTSTDLPPSTTTVPEGELGSGTFTNTEPSGTGEGGIEMETFSSNVPDDVPSGFTGTGDHNPEIAENDPATAGRELETHMDNLDSEASSATKTLASDTGKLDDALEGAGEAAGEAGEAGEATGEAADVAEDVGVDVAEAGMEAAGTALDATGIGAIVGIALNIGGLVLGAVTSSEDSTTKSTDETDIQNSITADQNKINQIKQQELNIKSQIAQQHFTGANIVPNISSTTLDNVTSSSF